MKNTFKKLLPVLIVAFVLVSVLAVTAFATDEWPALKKGKVNLLDMSQSGVEKTYYNDIDGNPAWVQVVTSSSAKARIFEDSHFYWGFNHRAYYNSATQTLVIIPSYAGATMSGRAGTMTTGEETVSDIANTNPNHFDSSMKKYYVHGFDGWLNTNGASVKSLEFRPFITSSGANSTKALIAEDFGNCVADNLTNLESVRLTTNFTFRCAGNATSQNNVLFSNKAFLKTVQYGDFAQNGTFSTDCPVNSVTLKEGNYTAGNRYGISAVTFSGCSSIERVIIKENTSGYVGIKNKMFNGCTSLKFVYINTVMSDSYQVGTDAFKGCSDFAVYVDNVDAATVLSAAGVTLKTHEGYEKDMAAYVDALTKELPEENAPISAKGILAKIADTTSEAGENVAIRFVFKWDEKSTASMGTPVKVGVIACSESYYNRIGVGTEIEKLIALLGDSNKVNVKQDTIAEYSSDGQLSLEGPFLKDGTDPAKGIYSYSYTLFGIPAANYDSEIYAATYIEWADGTYSVASNGYTDSTDTEKNTISLYDVTLGLFKNGLINSEKVADKYLWDVLEVQNGIKTKQLTSKNLEYFFLPDNIDGGYVLAYRAITKFADDDVTLKGAIIPHARTSGGPWQAYQDAYYSTNTIVVDYGVTKTDGTRTFGPNGDSSSTPNNESIKTLVYPATFDIGAGTHAFHKMNVLEDIIWCHTDSEGNYVPHMSDVKWHDKVTQFDHLYDMRGFGTSLVQDTINNLTAISKTSYKDNMLLSKDSVVSVLMTDTANHIRWKES